MKSLLKNLVFTVIIGLLAFSAVSVSAVEFSGYLSIASVEAYPGEAVAVPIQLNDNNVDFSTLFLPLRYDSNILKYDSISFDGSIMPTDFSGFSLDMANRELMQITYLPPFTTTIPSISVSNGLVGTLWFTLSEQAGPGFAPIDSASIDSISYVAGNTIEGWVGAVISNSKGDSTWFPDCLGGGITVLMPTSINENDQGSLPTSFALAQNYPNPFNPATVIEYSLAQAGQVKLEVFNVLGQNVSTLVEGSKLAGNHRVEFDASAYPSGIFFYRLTQGENSQTKKMVLVK